MVSSMGALVHDSKLTDSDPPARLEEAPSCRSSPPSLWPPRVIAHRGASATHPENTLAAFDAALAEGCDGLELDLQLSRDGVPVVYHDRTLRKAGGGARAVHQADWVEITRLDAGRWLDRRYAGRAGWPRWTTCSSVTRGAHGYYSISRSIR